MLEARRSGMREEEKEEVVSPFPNANYEGNNPGRLYVRRENYSGTLVGKGVRLSVLRP